MEDLKKCNKCGKMLPIEQFGKRWDISKTDGHLIEGYYGQCKECIAERKTAWREANPGYGKQYYERYKVLKPKITKVCPYCYKSFKTNNPNQIRCNQECKPMTEIRKLKSYLFAHPEIDRLSFFKGRYYRQYGYGPVTH